MDSNQLKMLFQKSIDYITGKDKSPPSCAELEQAARILGTLVFIDWDTYWLCKRALRENIDILENGIHRHENDQAFCKQARNKIEVYSKILDGLPYPDTTKTSTKIGVTTRAACTVEKKKQSQGPNLGPS